jgi:hypothetical protein
MGKAAVLITVSGGVADVAATSGEVDVEIIDFDNFKDGHDSDRGPIMLSGPVLRLAQGIEDLKEGEHYEAVKPTPTTIRIEHDQDCESPLEHDDIVITYKKGSRYTLGNTPVEQEEFEQLVARIQSGELIGLPVYAYVHSGVALKASSWAGLLPQGHAEWDSGLSGVAYITKATALEWHGGKIVTKKIRESCLKSLEGSVEAFGRWLNGECYGYVIEDEHGDEIDSCWGFVGHEYALEQAKALAPNAEVKE